MNSINKYKIQFLEKTILNTTSKTMYSPYPILNQLLTDLRTADDVNNYLLPIVDKVLNRFSESEIFITDTSLCIAVFFIDSKIYSDPDFSPSDQPELTLSTLEFKEIAEGWRDYLSLN